MFWMLMLLLMLLRLMSTVPPCTFQRLYTHGLERPCLHSTVPTIAAFGTCKGATRRPAIDIDAHEYCTAVELRSISKSTGRQV